MKSIPTFKISYSNCYSSPPPHLAPPGLSGSQFFSSHSGYFGCCIFCIRDILSSYRIRLLPHLYITYIRVYWVYIILHYIIILYILEYSQCCILFPLSSTTLLISATSFFVFVIPSSTFVCMSAYVYISFRAIQKSSTTFLLVFSTLYQNTHLLPCNNIYI